MSINYSSTDYIKTTILITALAAVSSELLSSLATHILIPLIDGDCNNDGKPDISHNIRSKQSKVGKKILYTGEFMFVIIKFILILLFLLLLRKLL